MVAGVCGGIADALGIDALVVRILWIILTIASFGLGVAAYAICWIAFPADDGAAPITQLRHIRHRGTGATIGALLLGIGLFIAFGQLVDLQPFRRFGAFAWATLLIGAGLAVLFLRRPADAPPNDHAPLPGPPDAPADTTATTTGEPDRVPPGASTARDYTAPIPGGPAPPGSTATAWTQAAPWPVPPPRPPRRPRPRPFLTPLTISVLLIGGGIVTLLDDNGTTHLTAAEVLAGALGIVGLALVLSTWFGRARALIPLGILLLLVTLPAATIDVPLTGGTGTRHYAPTARSELRPTYDMGIGKLALDLRQVPLAGSTTNVRARLGIGNLVVDVPSTVRVVVQAHSGVGAILLFGGNDGGWPARKTMSVPGTGRGELDLDLRVGAGAVQVHRFDATGAETIIGGNA